jgi:cell division cycle 20-like protein 1 (cofactor of APC complex)
MSGHTARVGSLAWSSSGILSSGSRDRTILHRDVRSPSHHFRTLTGHRQEVCGLKWNVEENQLASGGNDNKLMVWNGTEGGDPMWKFGQHGAAVKAIAWSPHQRGLLASGGGTADKKIRFWNTLSGTMLNAIDTGSQVRSPPAFPLIFRGSAS